ncbi:MAG: TonB family protein [Nitrospirae bacterium]|nr:TonB family protein [Nitrospirota bacterium]
MKKPKEFSATLVTPEETKKRVVRIPMSIPRPPVIPLPRTSRRPLLHTPSREDEAPFKPVTPLHTPDSLPEGKPLSEAGDSDAGKSLAEFGGKVSGKGSVADRGEDGDKAPGVEPAKPGPSPRARLFDRRVTDAVAQKDRGVKQGRGEGITFSTRQYRFKGYMDKLRSRIEGLWVYPPEALAKGIYGDLELTFTINKDGTLRGRPELVRTSGYRVLDDAAIKALKDGEPYWPLPEEWGMETYTIKGHFIYGLYGNYLR